MKAYTVFKYLALAGLLTFAINAHAQTDSTWTEKQLMQPAVLANMLKTNAASVTIISVGPFSDIPGSIHVGMVKDADNLAKFKTQLSKLNKNRRIVVYCGCCPFDHCPDIRPAMQTLKEMKFTNYYLLDLRHNLKVNWIDPGYPVVKE